jgi:parallel beta-helix repeat protein
VESEVKSSSRICPITPVSKTRLNLRQRINLQPNPIIVALSLLILLGTAGLVYSIQFSPYYWDSTSEDDETRDIAAIAIDGDANFSATALQEGWPGDGSPEHPYVIRGLNIDLGSGAYHCIKISNTRVSFTISNCNLTGAIRGTGYDPGGAIFLENVANGELVNNTCISNFIGIYLVRSQANTIVNNTCIYNKAGIYIYDSTNNIVINNTCNGNQRGIRLEDSEINTMVNNTCNSNDEFGIRFRQSHLDTVVNNICNNNRIGIRLDDSNSNTLANNTCNSNSERGIHLDTSSLNIVVNNTCTNNTSNGIKVRGGADSNTVANNMCNNNGIGIELEQSNNTVVNNICSNNRIGIFLHELLHEPPSETVSDTVANNTFSGNAEHDIFDESGTEEPFDERAHQEYVAKQFVWFLAGSGMILMVSVIVVEQYRRMEI